MSRSRRFTSDHTCCAPGRKVPIVNLSLWQADAVVLFDWLMTTDLDTVPITHPAQ